MHLGYALSVYTHYSVCPGVRTLGYALWACGLLVLVAVKGVYVCVYVYRCIGQREGNKVLIDSDLEF